MSKNELVEFDENVIRDRIYSIRGYQVMLDRDLAELYWVETKVLNQAVKRNKERFPGHYCFRLTQSEKEEVVTNCDHLSVLRFSYNLPYAFTEQGVAMLSAILKSKVAIQISITIIDAFISMRKFIQKNGLLFHRVDNLEVKQIETNLKLIENDRKFDKVFSLLESKDSLPKQGIFYENKIFDAYKFVSDLFRSASKSILIIDNYIDDSVLIHLTKVTKGVKVKILTKAISDQLALDVKKFSSQYFLIEIIAFTHAHDRFIIIDNKDVYHLGASLKDLGKKWFAFSKIDKADMELLSRLEKY